LVDFKALRSDLPTQPTSSNSAFGKVESVSLEQSPVTPDQIRRIAKRKQLPAFISTTESVGEEILLLDNLSFKDREQRIALILLLSDGQPNDGITDSSVLFQSAKQV
jgi:hypothetical protein